MYYSFFEIFSIGIGPSSSHTVGPMNAASRFLSSLESKIDKCEKVDVKLYGSLALTAEGHRADRAIVLGLMGLEADKVDPAKPYMLSVERDKILNLAGKKSLKFDLDKNLILEKGIFLTKHSNGMIFEAYDSENNLLLSETYYSIGGGFVVREDEFGKEDAVEDNEDKIPYSFSSMEDILAICRKEKITIAEMIYENEKALHGEESLLAYIDKVEDLMEDTIERGMKNTGYLAGGLKIKRRANTIYLRLKDKFNSNNIDPLQIIDWINLWAFAAAEENGSGGKIITAPTNGAAGILPAVLRYFKRFAFHKTSFTEKKAVIEFLLTASAICNLYKKNASISGAEVGCQGEVGTACSMAAAGLTAVVHGSIEQVENAAEIGIEHNLGLTCDPVAGLVQVPCIERNAMAAIKAVNAARIALNGDGNHFIKLDKAIKTMAETGRDMQNKYKETSLGGLAVNVAEC